MTDPGLRIGVYPYEHTTALFDETVTVEGVRATFESAPLVSDIFRRMVRGELDVAELGLTLGDLRQHRVLVGQDALRPDARVVPVQRELADGPSRQIPRLRNAARARRRGRVSSVAGRRVRGVGDTETYEDDDFAGVDWYGEELGGGRYVRCRFFDADLTEVRTAGAVFEECDFSGARLNASRHRMTAFLRCTFNRASLFDATFDGCKMTGSEFSSTRMRPLTVKGGDWSYVALRGADLAGLDLSGVNLAYADLTDADLRKTVLRDAVLDHARLRLAELRGADLRGADLNAVETGTLDLRDVKVTMVQAVLLAQHRGAVVDG